VAGTVPRGIFNRKKPVSTQGTHLTTRLSDITTTITGLETIGSVRQVDLLKMGVNTPETC
jgi:hypothetical protein